MRFLHENYITVNINYPNSTALPQGLYTYRVRERSYHDSDDDDCRIVFVGNFYADGRERYHVFNLTEIFRNDVEVFANDSVLSGSNNVRLVTTYWMEIYTGSVWVKSSDIQVAHIYEYPNRVAQNQSYLRANSVFFDAALYTNGHVTVTLQGFNRYLQEPSNKCSLLPRYPLYEDGQSMGGSSCPFGITVETGTSIQSLELRAIYAGDDVAEDSLRTTTLDYLSYTYNTTTYKGTIGSVVGDNYGDSFYDNVELWLVSTHPTTPASMKYSRVAIFELCHSRYYLYWQDRFGSFQCQPFSDVADYSEDIEVSEMQNYMDIRRRGNVSVQPKWRINSGWISERVYPFYESLYVSPVLKLMDTETDQVYDVIFTGNYTEKTIKNQKKLVNLTLDLEQTYKQNILY